MHGFGDTEQALRRNMTAARSRANGFAMLVRESDGRRDDAAFRLRQG